MNTGYINNYVLEKKITASSKQKYLVCSTVRKKKVKKTHKMIVSVST